MKRRPVLSSGGNDNLDNPPSAVPTAQALTAWLNRIFVPQLNATIEITTFPTRLRLNWDIGAVIPNGALDVNVLDEHSPEQIAIVNAIPTGTPEPNITVFLLGGPNQIQAGSTKALGLTNRAQRTVWVMAENLGDRLTEDVGQTIGHEMGHMLVDYGHPDESRNPGHLSGD